MSDSVDAVRRCPVVDFDKESPEYAERGPELLREMRENAPRAWSVNHGGFWVATRYQDILRINQSPEYFGTAKTIDPETGLYEGGTGVPTSQDVPQVPLEVDNPEWQEFRNLLNRKFAPKAAEERRPFIRKVVRTLVDRVIEHGEMELVDDLTSPLPAIFTMDFLGLDLKYWKFFSDAYHGLISTPRTDPALAERLGMIQEGYEILKREAQDRREAPRDDLLSYIANGRVFGRPLTPQECLEVATIIVSGGVDTTTALMSNALRYLAHNPADRQRLIDQPDLLPYAREEFLRYYTPVQGQARNARVDCEIDGWAFKKHERVICSYAAANRDPDIFENAEDVKIDRFPNRHIGFGAGMHRCMGSFFARVMIEEVLTEVLDRLPDYKLVEGGEVKYASTGSVNGWVHVPITFSPGRKLGGGVEGLFVG